MKVDISVVIPTRNREKSLLETINSLCRGKYIPKEIIIVDQSDRMYKDNIEKTLMNFNKTKIIYKHLSIPSLTKARNEGMEMTNFNIVICCDDDILVENETLYNIFNEFKNDNNIALIGGLDSRELKINNNHKIQSTLGYIFARKNIFKKNGHVTKAIFGSYPKVINKKIDTEWAMGYFFAIRKDILLKSKQKWDENLTSYAYPEDLDFSYRFYSYLRRSNMKMILDPNIRVEHCVSKEWRETSRMQTLMYIINREYISYKLYPKNIYVRIVLRWANIGEFFRRLVKRDNPIDVIIAQYICDKNRKKIKNGIIKYE